MSSVARCYTPLKANIYIKPKDQFEMRRDSFEIGVFDASNYYSSIIETDDANNNADCVLDDGKDAHSTKIMHSIDNLLRSCDPEEPKKKKKNNKLIKKLQPSSPGGKLASYLHSILNQTLVSKPKKNKPLSSFEDDTKSRSSSMSLARSVDMAEAASVHSCPSYTSYTRQRPTPTLTSANARAVHIKPAGYKDLRSYSSCTSSKPASLPDVETTLVGGERSWPALKWFDQELKIRKEVHYGLKKVKEEDGMESDSSSDLFELRHCNFKVQDSLAR